MTVNPGLVDSDGMTLKAAVSLAFGVPGVRIVGPESLNQTRYAIRAVSEDKDAFRPLFQEELRRRLKLVTHLETRSFEVFVLTPAGRHRLEAAPTGTETRTWIHESDARLEGASMERVAGALQSILAIPVMNETDIRGSYNLKFAWGTPRVESVTAVMAERFGLKLTAGRRDMEALVVDSVQPEASLALLERIGRLTERTPPAVRQRISQALAIH
jgi:uncharacterized protein (TIGR03435 family)